MKILIAGAGPTGLTAGVELARRGIHVEIIDRRNEASTLSRAVGINPRSLEILTPSGVTAKLLAQGVKYNAVRIYRETTPWATLPLTSAPIQHGYNFILGLPQDQTEGILRDTFVSLGGIINYGTELTGVRQNSNQVIAETAVGNELPCDYLIGADGVRSATRESLGIVYEGHDLPDIWSIADVDADWPHKNDATICLIRNGKMAAIVPLGENRFRFISNTKSALAALPLDINVSNIRREGQFKVSLSQVKEYGKGRVFLAGDAAHSQSPAGGRGMNLGIADSADLATRLAGDDLANYSQTRHEEGKRVIAGSERMRKVLTSASPITRSLVLAGLKTASVLPALQRKFASKFLYG